MKSPFELSEPHLYAIVYEDKIITINLRDLANKYEKQNNVTLKENPSHLNRLTDQFSNFVNKQIFSSDSVAIGVCMTSAIQEDG